MMTRRMREIRDTIILLVAGAIIITTMILGAIDAAVREDENRDEIRKERCGRWGEDLPKEMEGYCDNLGV